MGNKSKKRLGTKKVRSLRDLKPRGQKPQLQMAPLAPRIWAARTYEHGAKTYARGNYFNTVPGESPWEKSSEYLRAALGHILETTEQMERAFGSGRLGALAIDLESGLPHLGHALVSLELAIVSLVDGGVAPKDPKAPKTLIPEKKS